jgi:hypothetical protein
MDMVHSARKHNIPDEDILHAVDYAIFVLPMDGYTMVIGPRISGELIEIAINRNEQIFHAMPARPKYLRTRR